MSNEISFTDSADIETAELTDEATENMRDSVVGAIEREQMQKNVRAEMGITEKPTAAESVPPELPKMVFSIGAKVIGCDKFNLDEKEASTMATHLSIIVGPMNSKLYSLFIIISISISKVCDCWKKAKGLFNKSGGEVKEFDEATQSTETVYGDGAK